MKSTFLFLILAIATACTSGQSNPMDETPNNVIVNHSDSLSITDYVTHKTQLVFCLDATGSMNGLIGTAKEKIWSIITALSEDSTVSEVELGMIFYRDRGDNFTTLPIPLTVNIDSIYTQLMTMNAQGGGDAPESVNQALYEAVSFNTWSLDSGIYKTIFVVGDCPPHMDYRDDVKYTQSCEMAAKKGIVINTIKLGSDCENAIYHFQQMARCSGGEYLHLEQDANDITVETPYDDQIRDLSLDIEKSKMYYGNSSEKRQAYEQKEKSIELYETATKSATNDRAKYNSSKAGQKNWMGEKELITDLKDKKVKLEDLAAEDLPEELKDIPQEELEKIISEKEAERIAKIAELQKLNDLREKYIQEEIAKDEENISFSKSVKGVIKKQKGK